MTASTDNTAQLGVNAVEQIFLSMGWIFRRQLESDVGVDAQVEPVIDGEASGQLIALQIKSGPSFFRKRAGNVVYYGKAKHLEYWEKHALPVLLILHNPGNLETIWVRVERHNAQVGENGAWSIDIPAHNTLTTQSAESILDRVPRSDPESRRRRRMALDSKVIARANEEGAYIRLDDWVNKSLRFRGAEISFDGPYGEAEIDVPFMAAGYSIGEIFDELFPWADYTYHDEPTNYSGEVDVHTFEVTVNDLGKAFLALENFYANGRDPSHEPDDPRASEDEVLSDDDFDELMYERALARDRS